MTQNWSQNFGGFDKLSEASNGPIGLILQGFEDPYVSANPWIISPLGPWEGYQI